MTKPLNTVRLPIIMSEEQKEELKKVKEKFINNLMNDVTENREKIYEYIEYGIDNDNIFQDQNKSNAFFTIYTEIVLNSKITSVMSKETAYKTICDEISKTMQPRTPIFSWNIIEEYVKSNGGFDGISLEKELMNYIAVKIEKNF